MTTRKSRGTPVYLLWCGNYKNVKSNYVFLTRNNLLYDLDGNFLNSGTMGHPITLSQVVDEHKDIVTEAVQRFGLIILTGPSEGLTEVLLGKPTSKNMKLKHVNDQSAQSKTLSISDDIFTEDK